MNMKRKWPPTSVLSGFSKPFLSSQTNLSETQTSTHHSLSFLALPQGPKNHSSIRCYFAASYLGPCHYLPSSLWCYLSFTCSVTVVRNPLFCSRRHLRHTHAVFKNTLLEFSSPFITMASRALAIVSGLSLLGPALVMGEDPITFTTVAAREHPATTSMAELLRVRAEHPSTMGGHTGSKSVEHRATHDEVVLSVAQSIIHAAHSLPTQHVSKDHITSVPNNEAAASFTTQVVVGATPTRRQEPMPTETHYLVYPDRCTTGQWRCNGDVLQVCLVGFWSDSYTCADGCAEFEDGQARCSEWGYDEPDTPEPGDQEHGADEEHGENDASSIHAVPNARTLGTTHAGDGNEPCGNS
ncbi:hypothetical protein F4778DRAFT_533656 [Xylariomycetidae sp. FL2044]|nr:hypothetical protein F4778DRAFT_533656 [Xylariomycetidae sp. FL2044]